MGEQRGWVMMDGLAGAGKSTLAAALADRLRAAGATVDLFGEEQLFTRPEFAAVADGFRTKRYPTPAMFEAAYGAYLAGSAADWAVFDWSAAGMSGDLDWALQDRAAYVRHLRQVAGLDPSRHLVLLSLRSDPRAAVERAAAQRGEPWIERYDGLAVQAGFTGADPLDRITARAIDQLGPAAAELEAASEAGWRMVTIDASQPPGQVVDEAFTAVLG